MTLADTSVWVDHFHRGNARLRQLLEDADVVMHPMVLGELACGTLARRHETLHLLGNLPTIAQAPDRIVFEAIESGRLWGKRIGWIDAHLVVASRGAGVSLWSLDRRLAAFCGGGSGK